MVPYLVALLNDDAAAVRVAVKRALRAVGARVLGGSDAAAALLASSALDERWKARLVI